MRLFHEYHTLSLHELVEQSNQPSNINNTSFCGYYFKMKSKTLPIVYIWCSIIHWLHTMMLSCHCLDAMPSAR